MNNLDFLHQLSRADVLLGQGRYVQAEELLKNILSNGLENVEVLKMLALAEIGLSKYKEATQLCQMIIEQYPNQPFVFYLFSVIHAAERQYVEAKNKIDIAISLDAANSDYHAFKSTLYLQTKDYAEALASADQALALNAEDITALNARASSLFGLGMKTEAMLTIDKSLATDPNNTNTHANIGWSKLHQANPNQALIHFKTALQEDPMNSYAKIGMQEAMKAKFPLYKYFLSIMLWISKWKGKSQWTIIIVSYIILRLAQYMAEKYEILQPILIPILILVGLFFLLTWIFSPLMNLYLLTNSFGRLTLSSEQKKSAIYVGIALSTSILALFISIFVHPHIGFLALALFSFIMMIPLSSMYNPISSIQKNNCIRASKILLGLSIICVISLFYINDINNFTFYLPIFGVLGYQIYLNYVMTRE